MKLTEKDLDILLGESNCERHKLRIHLSDSIRIHSNGELDLIRNLLNKRLPSEPPGITEYRLANISRITKTYFDKIVTTLSKIQNAEDFSYKFPNKYLTEFFTLYFSECHESIFEWYYEIGLKCLLTNPNGYFVVLPEEVFSVKWNIPLYENEGEQVVSLTRGDVVPSSDAYKAFEFMVVSEKDIIVDGGDYIVFKSKELSDNELLYIDVNEIWLLTIIENPQTKKKRIEYVELMKYSLATNKPCFIKIGGAFFDIDYEGISESFISGIVPFFNQAIIEFSDKTAGIKQHVYPEKWRVKSKDCKECGGSGQLVTMLKGKSSTSTCNSCGGSGTYNPPTGMFSEHIIDSTVFEQKAVMPPVGYVAKDLKPLEFIDNDITKNLYSGLAAINMEHLLEVPLSQSGTAKEVDRNELNNFVRKIASHTINKNLLPLAKLFTAWINYVSGSFVNDIVINVPTHYDLTGSNSYEAKILLAKQSGLDKSVLQTLEQKYINSKFANDVETKQRLLLINKLNPLYGYTIDELNKAYDDSSISLEDYTISMNISNLVDKAIWTMNGSKFYNMNFLEQQDFIANLVVNLSTLKENGIRTETDNTVVPNQGHGINQLNEVGIGTDTKTA